MKIKNNLQCINTASTHIKNLKWALKNLLYTDFNTIEKLRGDNHVYKHAHILNN